MGDCIKEYCVGCGLCSSVEGQLLKKDTRGFYYPEDTKSPLLKKICPASGIHTYYMDKNDIWGKSEKVYIGWSNNKALRNKASSGGILTELAAYALENNYVDTVMHTEVNSISPTETVTTFSNSREELERKCGSRYSISHPLDKIGQLDKSKRYLFIGKPCDVITLRNYISLNPEMKHVIPYMFSFFCAGLPSVTAQEKLLLKMGTSIEECQSLKYRGDGWPGFATAKDFEGKIFKMEYREAWGKTLGRDIMKACRICIDGIGEMADISCGDVWYLNDDETPDFGEHEGRNVIFSRTAVGTELIKNAIKDKVIHVEDFPEYNEYLNKIQKYQYERKATMKVKLFVLKVLGRSVPAYDPKTMKQFSKAIDIRKQIRIAAGTLKRALNGKF